MIRLFTLVLISLSAGIPCASAVELKDDWIWLFDARMMKGWRDFCGKKFTQTDSWQVKDGCLVSLGKKGDIVTTQQFGDFELAFEWRVTAAANSGVFYRLQESVAWLHESGLEYQVLDNVGQAGRVVTEQA